MQSKEYQRYRQWTMVQKLIVWTNRHKRWPGSGLLLTILRTTEEIIKAEMWRDAQKAGCDEY